MNPPAQRGVIVLLNSESRSWHFFKGQIQEMTNAGWEVHTVSAIGPELKDTRAQGATPHEIKIKRTITPFSDLAVIARLVRLFRQLKPRIVHAHTTKASLVALVAAKLAGVPVRIYHNHGMAALSSHGWRRSLLRASEKLCSTLATRAVYVAPSVRSAAIAEGLARADRSSYILSINGLDTEGQFNPVNHVQSKIGTKQLVGFPPEAFVLGYSGRLLTIKGTVQLVAAWEVLRERYPQMRMLVVGEYDYKDPLPTSTRQALESDPRIHMTGHVSNPEKYFAIMDVLVLPSFHEGLGYVLIEAQSMQVPCIATKVPGTIDAVVPNKTGLLIPPKDPAAIVKAVSRYLEDPALRVLHGRAARKNVTKLFNQRTVWDRTLALYDELTATGRT